MTPPRCDICNDDRRVRLPIYHQLSAIDMLSDNTPSYPQASYRTFDCPQCLPVVPYRRVRAMKVATAYEAEEFGKFQVPIERAMAARFGEYLLREGLLKFTTDSLDDFTKSKVTVTAHLNVVSREDAKKAGAAEEVALISPPILSKKLTRQQQERVKVSPRATRWDPSPAPWASAEPAADEFDEPKGALNARFSGLELDP